jgi:hypothetical protein
MHVISIMICGSFLLIKRWHVYSIFVNQVTSYILQGIKKEQEVLQELLYGVARFILVFILPTCHIKYDAPNYYNLWTAALFPAYYFIKDCTQTNTCFSYNLNTAGDVDRNTTATTVHASCSPQLWGLFIL